MFKKLFLGGLALLLAFGLAFQAAPAFALGSAPEPGVSPPPPMLAQINQVVLLETTPRQVKISGTLPSYCYQPRVSVSLVSPVKADGSAGRISIQVYRVWLSGVMCIENPRPFTTSVTLDPVKLNLRPGKYVVLVNPVNGQSRFNVAFTVRPPQMEIVVPATLKTVTTLASYPPQYKISGTLPASCYAVRVLAPNVAGKVISIFVKGAAPQGLSCGTALKPFSTSITLDPAKLKLAPGRYLVLFNPVNGESRFKTELVVQ